VDKVVWLSEIAYMCNYCLVSSSMFKVLVSMIQMENTKLTANAIGKGAG